MQALSLAARVKDLIPHFTGFFGMYCLPTYLPQSEAWSRPLLRCALEDSWPWNLLSSISSSILILSMRFGQELVLWLTCNIHKMSSKRSRYYSGEEGNLGYPGGVPVILDCWYGDDPHIDHKGQESFDLADRY